MKVKAGRELDLLVATKVMGITPLEFSAMWGPEHRYSTIMADAWEVRERVGRLIRLEDYGAYGWRCVLLAGQPSQEDVDAKGETAPVAICIAALLTVQQRMEIET